MSKGLKGFNTVKGFTYGGPLFLIIALFIVSIFVLVWFVPSMLSSSVAYARSVVERADYVVLSSSEYSSLSSKLDLIAASADAAVVSAQRAVIEAQNAVIAAQAAAAKVDLFNSAEVYLFPGVTNVTVTLTAGNTNVFSAWTEVADSNAVTLSSKFATKAGYVSDMYIYNHSAVDKLYCLELSYGVAKTTLGKVMYHTSFIEMAQIKSRRVPAGETVYYRLMCSGANNATVKVGFRYFYEE